MLERGPALDERVKAVEHFSATGELDENANIQFGEGGAGTFSDGKLTTRIGDELCGFVTEVFLEHGAPKEIAWQQKPHVGTDLLRGVITSIRKEIESLGGEVHFNTALTGFERRDGQLVGIQTTDGAFPCEALVFAVGHSARDTFGMLMDSGLVLECKPFSVGFRQSISNRRSKRASTTRRRAIRPCRAANISFRSTLKNGVFIRSVCVRAARWWLRPAKRAAS